LEEENRRLKKELEVLRLFLQSARRRRNTSGLRGKKDSTPNISMQDSLSFQKWLLSLLSVIRKRKLYKPAGKPYSILPNLLNQNFTAQKKNRKWVTGITYIRTSQGLLPKPGEA